MIFKAVKKRRDYGKETGFSLPGRGSPFQEFQDVAISLQATGSLTARILGKIQITGSLSSL
jgi:hypothetical protein